MDITNVMTVVFSFVVFVLEYAAPVWTPYKKKLVTLIENVQRRATKQLKGMSEKTYIERLKELKLPTLVYRRWRGDMIETYKMLNDKYDPDLPGFLQKARQNAGTRGHSLKIRHQFSKKNVRKYYFALRICNLWNDLPQEVVTSPNVRVFERRLDRYWANQEFKYDFEATYKSRDNTKTNLFEDDEDELVIVA